MSRVEIYTTRYCGYCRRARMLLEGKQISYEEISVDGDPEGRARMTARSNGRRSVPQIFINDRSIGGCDELFQLDREGQLDKLLGSESGND
jgi:glutaredoxin 3